MNAASLAKTTGGPAAVLGAALGDALGRPLAGLEPRAAALRVPSSDALLALVSPPLHESDPLREALPGTPSAAIAVALAAAESSLCGPDTGEALVTDALRRCAALAWPRHPGAPQGALLAPTGPMLETCAAYGQGVHALSCGTDQPDAALLPTALLLGAVGTSASRAAHILRALTRDPVTLCSGVALSETVRRAALAESTVDSLVADARAAEEDAFKSLAELPGSLAGPAEMGHGAVAMSLARARASLSGEDALLPLSRDTANSPEVVLACVLGALMVEPAHLPRHVAVALRHGGTANIATSVLLGVGGVLFGLKGYPLAWLNGLRNGDRLLAWSDAACSRKKAGRLLFPAADLAWEWQATEHPWRAEREVTRKSSPPPAPSQQMGLFGDE